jgi:hypothetical protein
MINGNRMHLSSNSNLIAKGLNAYVKRPSLGIVFSTFAKISKPVFAFSV